MIEKNCFAAERFRPAFNAPALLPKVRLDFDSQDAKEQFITPEGRLGKCVFVSTTTKNLTVARGARSPVHEVAGMAGVGKTTALIGLDHDSDSKALAQSTLSCSQMRCIVECQYWMPRSVLAWTLYTKLMTGS